MLNPISRDLSEIKYLRSWIQMLAYLFNQLLDTTWTYVEVSKSVLVRKIRKSEQGTLAELKVFLGVGRWHCTVVAFLLRTQPSRVQIWLLEKEPIRLSQGTCRSNIAWLQRYLLRLRLTSSYLLTKDVKLLKISMECLLTSASWIKNPDHLKMSKPKFSS